MNMETLCNLAVLVTVIIGCLRFCNGQNANVLEKKFANIETSAHWTVESQAYEIHFNSSFSVTCKYENVIATRFNLVIWNIDNACERTERNFAIKGGDNLRQSKLGDVIVMPAGNLPITAPKNGSLTLTHQEGPPEAYFNVPDCPVIKYGCLLQLVQSLDLEQQDIVHQINYESELNITVIGLASKHVMDVKTSASYDTQTAIHRVDPDQKFTVSCHYKSQSFRIQTGEIHWTVSDGCTPGTFEYFAFRSFMDPNMTQPSAKMYGQYANVTINPLFIPKTDTMSSEYISMSMVPLPHPISKDCDILRITCAVKSRKYMWSHEADEHSGVIDIAVDFPQSATADLTPSKSGNIAGAAGNGRILVTNPTLLSICLLVLACIAMIK